MSGRLDELIHQAAVISLLLVGVVVILRAGISLGAIEAERLFEIGIVGAEQAGRQSVDRGCVVARNESRLAVHILCNRIGRKIVIEADVLLEDDDDVLDRRLRVRAAAIVLIAVALIVVVLVGDARHRKTDAENRARSERGELPPPR